jgi:hypothetical protein
LVAVEHVDVVVADAEVDAVVDVDAVDADVVDDGVVAVVAAVVDSGMSIVGQKADYYMD